MSVTQDQVMTRDARARWFEDVGRAGGVMEALHPLVGMLTFAPEDFAGLREAVFRVLREAAGGTFEGTPEEFLRACDAGAVKADTTSGSIVKISYQTFTGYAALHRRITRLLARTGLLPRITGVSLANLRLVAGEAATPTMETRAYATSKTHIDVWAGEPSDIAHLWIPLFGDIEHTTMDMFAPPARLFSDGWLRPLQDYGDAEGLVTEPPLPIRYEFGRALLFDGACPHRTRRSRGATRVSMDVKLLREPFQAGTPFPSTYIGVDDLRQTFGDAR